MEVIFEKQGKKCFLLGLNEDKEKVWMESFSWDCGWYFGGGYIETKRSHSHFNGFYNYDWYDPEKECFQHKSLNLFDGFKKHIPETILTDKEIWRLCDLMRQFYALSDSAEVFQYGGHYTSDNRNPLELNKSMADKINEHIKTIIIPEVNKLFEEVEKRINKK